MTRTAISPRLAMRTFCSGLLCGTCAPGVGRLLRWAGYRLRRGCRREVSPTYAVHPAPARRPPRARRLPAMRPARRALALATLALTVAAPSPRPGPPEPPGLPGPPLRTRAGRLHVRGHRRRAVRRRPDRPLPRLDPADQRRPATSRSVVHVGDIKNGSSVCSDEYFAMIRADFDTLRRTRSSTPPATTSGPTATAPTTAPTTRSSGWPRSARRSSTAPGRTLGQHPARVASQADRGYPENVALPPGRRHLRRPLNVPGSNNGLQPWTGLGKTEPTPEQAASVRGAHARRRSTSCTPAFAQARASGTTAASWSCSRPTCSTRPYTPDRGRHLRVPPDGRRRSSTSPSRFDGPVYLFDGDSHVYNSRPAARDRLAVAGDVRRARRRGQPHPGDRGRLCEQRRLPAGEGQRGGGADLLTWERVPYTPRRGAPEPIEVNNR